ncbi:MAG: FtsX-like permease family protein [Clostridia bacterium]|nr:FtsX-like permease family protein [Clostridia bacterium]
MNIRKLPVKNLERKPVRTAMLIILTALLSLAVFGGTLVERSLRSGLTSLETRLGADIIVVPASAKSQYDLESILLEGVPGHFYMKKDYLDKVGKIEGIEKISAQYYLATVTSGCCSMPLQLIGFDPQTDFTVKPWIRQNYSGELGEFEIVIGGNINSAVGKTLKFYNQSCTVVGTLARTGTELDNAVFATAQTIKALIKSSEALGLNGQTREDPEQIISTIQIKVQEGYDIDDVMNDINIHITRVQAVRTRSMISGVADSLAGTAYIIRVLIAAVWVLALVILFAAFAAMVNERKREFAVLRVIGTSRSRLARIILAESALVSLLGGVFGILLGTAVVFPFSNLIESKLGLPFLLPGTGDILLLAALTLAVSVLVGAAAASYAAVKLSRVDTGLILREGN